MYGFDDILINPKSKCVDDLFGKNVYYGNSPQEVLENANNSRCYAKLSDVDDGGFFVEDDESGPFQCIIHKIGLSYRKFKGMEEFLEYASDHGLATLTPCEDYLCHTGIWLKSYSGEIFQVTRINGAGVGIEGCFYYWSDLLSDYLFLDGRRCGVYE